MFPEFELQALEQQRRRDIRALQRYREAQRLNAKAPAPLPDVKEPPDVMPLRQPVRGRPA